jgi:hypothetical protein
MINKLGLEYKMELASTQINHVVEDLQNHYSKDDTQTNEQTEHIQGLWERIQDDMASIRAYIVSI